MDDYDERVTQKEDRAKGDLLRELRDRSALGRVAAPADIANLVSYLVSPGANFITGESCCNFIAPASVHFMQTCVGQSVSTCVRSWVFENSFLGIDHHLFIDHRGWRDQLRLTRLMLLCCRTICTNKRDRKPKL